MAQERPAESTTASRPAPRPAPGCPIVSGGSELAARLRHALYHASTAVLGAPPEGVEPAERGAKPGPLASSYYYSVVLSVCRACPLRGVCPWLRAVLARRSSRSTRG